MSLVMTARLISGQRSRQSRSTRAVLPEPTGPATPRVKTLRRVAGVPGGSGPAQVVVVVGMIVGWSPCATRPCARVGAGGRGSPAKPAASDQRS